MTKFIILSRPLDILSRYLCSDSHGSQEIFRKPRKLTLSILMAIKCRIPGFFRMSTPKQLILASGLLFCSLAISAPPALIERRITSDGIKGLIVNQTITSVGYDFYLIFTELWREKPDGENYSLNIVERPSKRYGNQVWVYFGQTRVYAGIVPFKYDKIRPACEQAVETSYANIIAASLESPTSGDVDIAKEEL